MGSQKEKTPSLDFTFYRKILSLSRRVWWPLIFIGMFRTVLWIAIPLFAFALFSEQSQPIDQQALIRYSLILLVALIGMVFLDAISRQLLARSAYRFEGLLAGALFTTQLNEMRNLLALGERAGNPLELLSQRRDFWLQAGPLSILDIFLAPILIIFGLILHLQLGAIAALGFILLALILPPSYRLSIIVQRKAENISRRHSAMSRSVAILNDTVATMGLFSHLRNFWNQRREREFAAHMNATSIYLAVQIFTHSLVLVTFLAILAYGFWLFQQDQALLAEILAISLLNMRIFQPFLSLSGQARLWMRARMTKKILEQTAQLPLNAKNWKNDISGGFLAEQWEIVPKGELEPIFHVDKLHIEAGCITVIFGDSESGKSLLCRALTGATNYHGSISLDGIEMKECDQDILGETIGYLPQNLDLFSGTVGENIRRFNPQYSDDYVIQAAKDAGAHDSILELPRGYFYETGPGDSKISTGLKRKISLARALYRTPKILILDEPEAHTDSKGMQDLITLIQEQKKNQNTVVFATSHKKFFDLADNLVLLHKNQIITAGKKNAVISTLTS